MSPRRFLSQFPVTGRPLPRILVHPCRVIEGAGAGRDRLNFTAKTMSVTSSKESNALGTQTLGPAAWCQALAGSAALRHGADRLIEDYAPRLWRYFLRRGAGVEDSQDLVQEVFLRVIRERSSYRAELSFDGWVFGIARNLLVTRHRHRVTEARARDGFAQARQVLPQAQAIADAVSLEQDEERARLASAFDQLGEEDREILRLARYEGLDFAQVGQVLNCAPGTAKVRAFRALQRLRAALRSKG